MTSITLRPTDKDDAKYLEEWFKEPGILKGFPMQSDPEVLDSVRIWMHHSDMGAGLTALVDGKVAGMIVLYISPFKKFSHTCLFSIVVGEPYRKMGIATVLINEIAKIAKEKFHIEILHLEVYEGNDRAYRLYEKLGFERYGVQKKFIKENGSYLAKVLMQKKL